MSRPVSLMPALEVLPELRIGEIEPFFKTEGKMLESRNVCYRRERV